MLQIFGQKTPNLKESLTWGAQSFFFIWKFSPSSVFEYILKRLNSTGWWLSYTSVSWNEIFNFGNIGNVSKRHFGDTVSYTTIWSHEQWKIGVSFRQQFAKCISHIVFENKDVQYQHQATDKGY